jgi:uncharacterized protein YjaZ
MEIKNFNFLIENGKLSIKIVSFLDRSKFLRNKKKFLDVVIRELKTLREKDHTGGFLNEGGLRNQLEIDIFDKRAISKEYPSDKLKFEEVSNLVEEIINKSKNILGKREILIYLFPTNSYFIAKNMGGSSGFLAWRGIIHIHLYPTEDWKINFKSSLLHELAHCMQNYYSYNMNLFDHFIADGLAEHFQERLLNGKRNPWTKVIPKEKAKEIFKKIKSDLNKTMEDYPSIHFKLFFGDNEYPLWTGYTIGYCLVEDYLEQTKSIDWKELFNKEPNNFKNKLGGWFNN